MDEELRRLIEKARSGEIYDCTDERLLAWQRERVLLSDRYNRIVPDEAGLRERETLLREMLGSCGEGCYIEPPFRANWGGANLFLGRDVYVNFGLTVVDDGPIRVGDCTQFGPYVVIATALHPMGAESRRAGLQYNLAVEIGRDVWVGAGALILPGSVIGDGAVIGAGAVVRGEIPPRVLAAGNPCRVIREITEEDNLTYCHGRRIPEELLAGRPGWEESGSGREGGGALWQ